MFKYDFIILYEHRNRELENAVLLAMKLEKKGYKVAIEYRRSARILFQRSKVILAPFLYYDDNVIDFAFQPFMNCKKLINMQYEQVVTIDDEKTGNQFSLEHARDAIQIAWGQIPHELMRINGINEKNIFEIGQISMDLNFSKYDKLFISREDLSEKYNIPNNKKWLLFISSFSCTDILDAEMEEWASTTPTVYMFKDLSVKSQKVVLKYLVNICKKHKDYIVIYRPHPHEKDNKKIRAIEKKLPNFKCISDYSIRQWIRVSDTITTWCSTSIADVYFANKKCAIIRPYVFPEDIDYAIFMDQKIISDYASVEDFINNESEDYYLNGNTIKKYYCNSSHSDSFDKLLNLCIKTLKSDECSVNYRKKINVSRAHLLKIYIYKLLMTIAGIVDYSRFIPEKYAVDVFNSHREMKGYRKDIKEYRYRLGKELFDE
jgi:surface carbohydrate biosynthesis protein